MSAALFANAKFFIVFDNVSYSGSLTALGAYKLNFFSIKSALSFDKSALFAHLAGHTHRYGNRTAGGLTILNAETTCHNFDGLPAGYRRLELSPDGEMSWTFRRVNQA